MWGEDEAGGAPSIEGSEEELADGFLTLLLGKRLAPDNDKDQDQDFNITSEEIGLHQPHVSIGANSGRYIKSLRIRSHVYM